MCIIFACGGGESEGPGVCSAGDGSAGGAVGVVRTTDQEAQAERVAGGVGVHLEVIFLGRAASRLKHTSTELCHALVRSVEVLDPQIEVDLLLRCPVGPVRRDVVRCVLHSNAWFAVDDHHVPTIVAVNLAAEYPSPERTLRFNVCGIESDDLISDSHFANVPRTAMSTIWTRPTWRVSEPAFRDASSDRAPRVHLGGFAALEGPFRGVQDALPRSDRQRRRVR